MQKKIRNITGLGLLFALALVLSFLESLLPPVPFLPPGVKPGLSNIVTMYCLFYLGPLQAYSLILLKALFALITRGVTASMLSLFGGFAAVTVMLILMIPKKHMLSVFLLSVFGAVAHNIGQLAAAGFLIGGLAAAAYLPVLLVSGIVMGMLTGTILRAVLPAISKISSAAALH